MSSQITGLSQAQRNANDGISVAQTAEGALNQVNDNLQRVRELAVQAQNGTNSEKDLTSIQDEINQRLGEINRISDQTDFNGTKVLAEDKGLSIQVGANDGETIDVNLEEINAAALGLDGFNVDGSGETQNRAATVTDITAQDSVSGSGPDYTVTTEFEAAKASDIVGTLNDGDTVATTTGGGTTTTTYTYDAEADNFTYSKTVDDSGNGIKELAASIAPNIGTIEGSFENGDGTPAGFDVDSTGNITIGGDQAYLTSNGNLTNNDTDNSETKATLEGLMDSKAGTVSIDGTDYALSDDSTNATVTFTDTASESDVLAAVNASYTGTSGDGTSISMSSGLTSGTVDFNEKGATTDAYVDYNGELTDTGSFTTDYNVNQDTGEVTVTDNSATAGDYALEVGSTVNVAPDGRLTTDETSPGDRTEDPLAALDSALNQVDSLRSELGAVQNRFESAITNLSTNETNLSSARSRIEDADYATEVANMTKNQILQQAGTSVLAQANQLPQSVLSLLG